MFIIDDLIITHLIDILKQKGIGFTVNLMYIYFSVFNIIIGFCIQEIKKNLDLFFFG